MRIWHLFASECAFNMLASEKECVPHSDVKITKNNVLENEIQILGEVNREDIENLNYKYFNIRIYLLDFEHANKKSRILSVRLKNKSTQELSLLIYQSIHLNVPWKFFFV